MCPSLRTLAMRNTAFDWAPASGDLRNIHLALPGLERVDLDVMSLEEQVDIDGEASIEEYSERPALVAVHYQALARLPSLLDLRLSGVCLDTDYPSLGRLFDRCTSIRLEMEALPWTWNPFEDDFSAEATECMPPLGDPPQLRHLEIRIAGGWRLDEDDEDDDHIIAYLQDANLARLERVELFTSDSVYSVDECAEEREPWVELLKLRGFTCEEVLIARQHGGMEDRIIGRRTIM